MLARQRFETILTATLIGLAVVAGAPSAHAAEGAVAPAAEEFERLGRDFLRWYFAAHPVRATELGIHDHDSELPDLRERSVRRRAQELRSWLDRLDAIDRDELATDDRFDHEILEHEIRSLLLEVEAVRGWRRNPMVYTRAIADGVASLVDREFAPLPRRLQHLIDRLRATERLVRVARRNLEGVPRLWAELAARSTRGTVHYLRDQVGAALEEQGLAQLPPDARRRWERARRRAVAQLERFAAWLERDLTGRDDGDFRLGRQVFERKLFYDEHFALDAEELRRINEAAIAEYREWVDREAARIDPALAPKQVMARVAADHPTADELIATARRYVEQARELVVRRGLVTLPTDALPTIRPTPPYARSGFASMSTPGPFETVATEAYYNLTNVDPGWSEQDQEDHLTYFNHAGLLGISVHEVMPGHYVQLLYRKQIPSDLRRVFLPASVVEGWAHYVEQMMVDEGLGDGDPAVRLGQLRRALQRHARWDAGLGMHAFDVPLEQAAARFRDIALFAPFPALREAQRGTYDPTYLYYALGRMEIFRLREDYRSYLESRGETFSLREFHDRFLRLGLPIPLARRALMPEPAAER